MNPTSIAAFVLEFLGSDPALFADVGNLVNSIAHGEGGTTKATNILSNVSALVGHAGAAIASAPPAPPAQPEAQTAPQAPPGGSPM